MDSLHSTSARSLAGPLDTQRYRRDIHLARFGQRILIGVGLHLILGIAGVLVHSPHLVWLEIGSVAVYLIAYGLDDFGVRNVFTAAIWLDLLGHSTLAAWIAGPDSGFQFYSWILLLLVFANPYRAVRTKTCLVVGLAIAYVLLDWWLRHVTPLTSLSADAITVLRYFNLTSSLLAMALTAVSFARFVNSVEARLRTAAGTDALTGLLNRRRMSDHMREALQVASKQGGAPAVLLLDVDHFKLINDRYGHHRGDQVLEIVGRILRESVRQHDFVARWGGEEFLVMLPDSSIEVAIETAERVRDSIFSSVHQSEIDRAPVSVTIGIAVWRKDEGLEATIHRADLALYEGKRAGRNHVVTEEALASQRHAG